MSTNLYEKAKRAVEEYRCHPADGPTSGAMIALDAALLEAEKVRERQVKCKREKGHIVGMLYEGVSANHGTLGNDQRMSVVTGKLFKRIQKDARFNRYCFFPHAACPDCGERLEGGDAGDG